MDRAHFHRQKKQFIKGIRAVLSKHGKTPPLVEAGFCAYADPNPLIRFLFWRRMWLTARLIEASGPYDAILDFGCGAGIGASLLAPFCNRLTGLDRDLGPYRLLSPHVSYPSNVELYETRDHPLCDLGDRSFDAVVALDVLEHVEDLQGVMTNLCRVVKPGGPVVFCGPTESVVYRIGRRIAGKEYTGDYHVRNIYDIRRVTDSLMHVETVATLYYPFPLFKIYIGRPKPLTTDAPPR